MIKQDLSLRLTCRYVGTYRHLDEWRAVFETRVTYNY